MLRHTLKSLIRLILLLLTVSLVSFILIEASPLDPVQSYLGSADIVSAEQRAAIESYFNLDKNPVERFGLWLGAVLQLDLGISIIYRQPVFDIIAERFWSSFFLMLSTWFLAGMLGVLLGLLMGANKGSKFDRILKSFCLTVSAIPTFLLGMIFLIIFSVYLGWFPIGFSAPIGMLKNEITIWHRIYHIVLPCLVLTLSSLAVIALHTREKLNQVMQSNYVLLAKTRGLSRLKIVLRHGVRNILLPITTIQFASLSEIFGGSILAETVFSYPGLGSTLVKAGLRGDVSLLLGITLFSAVFVFVGNVTANILYGFIDPKIKAAAQ